jgi:hypothetical protein
MEMFLLAFAMSLLGVGVSAALFSAATRGVDEAPDARPAQAPARESPRFFADAIVAGAPPPTRVPIEALLLQIERHVQLEQAAAESFLSRPTRQGLHSRTASPLVH